MTGLQYFAGARHTEGIAMERGTIIASRTRRRCDGRRSSLAGKKEELHEGSVRESVVAIEMHMQLELECSIYTNWI